MPFLRHYPCYQFSSSDHSVISGDDLIERTLVDWRRRTLPTAICRTVIRCSAFGCCQMPCLTLFGEDTILFGIVDRRERVIRLVDLV